MDLGALLGGLTDPDGQGGDESSQQMQDMLGALLGGMQEGGGQPASSGDDVLGSLMGGGQGAPASAGGEDLGDLLGSLMGGGGQGGQGADPMMGMLGGMMGGGQSATGMGSQNTGMNAALAPLADLLAEKLNIPRGTALAVMAVVVPMLMNKLMNSGQAPGDDPLGGVGRSMQRQGLTFSESEADEMTQEVAAQTGMDQASAARALDGAMQVLSGQ